MPLLNRLTLRQMLILPYVILVLALALIIGLLSFRAGSHAIDNLSGQMLSETAQRIAQAVGKHVEGSAAVLETAFPGGMAAPVTLENELKQLRTRFWQATSIHREPHNYAYYGDREGRFFGVWRYSAYSAELRLRTTGEGPRTLYQFNGIHGELTAPATEARIFEPRERPWYAIGRDSVLPVWTPIYIDFRSAALVMTRARRVLDASGDFAGVVATDLSLGMINQFLRGLTLSRNGLALVLEEDGNIIGTSRGPHLQVTPEGVNARLNAADSSDPFIATTYREVRDLLSQTAGADQYSGYFQQADGSQVQVAYVRIQEASGLDWLVIVAVPRGDFLGGITHNFQQTAWVALLAAFVVVLIGLSVLHSVSRELRGLASAARHVGEGQSVTAPGTARRDEIGDLARSFATMQQKLLTDRLTGLSNREAILRRIEERIGQQRRAGDPHRFAVLFLDFNGFKGINDRFGHDIGDRVLQELGQRLARQLRSSDLVARYAGDEFLILLEGLGNRDAASRIRGQLETLLAEPLRSLGTHSGDVPNLGAAIGLALFPEDGADVDSLIRAADADMYRRKNIQRETGQPPADTPSDA